MKDIYKQNQEIVVFFNKAQRKIADLAGIQASDEDDEVSETLLLDLSDFIESLDSPYCYFSIVDTIRYIHYWNKRANLYSIPFIQITDYVVNIILPGGGTGSPDLTDLESTIRDILSRFPHNSLSLLQGGNLLERYHVSKEMYDWITCQMGKSPCSDLTESSVSLALTTTNKLWPSGYYEMGTRMNSVTLKGSIEGSSINKPSVTRYKKDGVLLDGSQNLNPTNIVVNPYTDSSGVRYDVSYSFEAMFSSGLKSDTKKISFLPPIYYGVLKRSSITSAAVKTLTKDVKPVGYMEITYTLPTGNTLLKNGNESTAVIEYPAEWGVPRSVKVLEYDFLPDWTFTQTTNTLADGSTIQVIRGVYNTTFEGLTTFKFTFGTSSTTSITPTTPIDPPVDTPRNPTTPTTPPIYSPVDTPTY